MSRYAGLNNSFLEECLKAHLNIDPDRISIGSGKSDLDEEYYIHRPDPIPQNVLIENCVRIDGSSVTNIPKESPRKYSQSNYNKQQYIPYQRSLIEPPRNTPENSSFNHIRRETAFNPKNVENSDFVVKRSVGNQIQRNFKEEDVNVACMPTLQSSTPTNNHWRPSSETVFLRNNTSTTQRRIEKVENPNDSKDNSRNIIDNDDYKSNTASSSGSNHFTGRGSTYSKSTAESISLQGAHLRKSSTFSSGSCTVKPDRSSPDNYNKPNQVLPASNIPRGRTMLSNVRTTRNVVLNRQIRYQQLPYHASNDVSVAGSIQNEEEAPCCICVIL